MAEELPQMSVLDHLEEFRRRLIISLAAFAVAACLSFFFAQPILRLLMFPLRMFPAAQQILHLRSPFETVNVYLKISMVGGVFLAFPVLFFQLWRFVAPGLYRHERKNIFPSLLLAWVLFVVGAMFAFFIALPILLLMLTKLNPAGVENTWFVTEFVSMELTVMIIFGLVFEVPLVMVLLARLGIVNARWLSKYRGITIIIIAIIAAIFSPPDVISQFTVGIPLYLFYELSLVLIRWFGVKAVPRPEAADEPTEEDKPE